MSSSITRLFLILSLALLLPGCAHHYGRGYDRGYGSYSGHHYGNPGYYYDDDHRHRHDGYRDNRTAYPRYEAPSRHYGYPSGGQHFRDRDHDDHGRGGREQPRPRDDAWGGGNWNRPNQPGPDRGGGGERLHRQEAERSDHWQQAERHKQQEIQSRPPAFQPSAGQMQRRQEAMQEHQQRLQQFAAPTNNPSGRGGGTGMERGFKRNRRD